MDITARSSSSSSSTPFFHDDSSNSTSLLTPHTLRKHRSLTSHPSTPPPAYDTFSKLHDQPYFPHHLHERQLTLKGAAALESDIADELRDLIAKPLLPTPSPAPPPKHSPISKGPIGPHISNLPRRRARPQQPKPDLTIPVADRKIPQRDECRCLQELVPGLFVAFEDDRLAFGDAAAVGGEGERLKTQRGEDFTHIVSLSTESGAEAAMARDGGADAAAHLRLVIPSARDAADDEDDEDVPPQLSQSQLVAARDFLAATNLRLSPTAYSQSADVRILITTPRSHRVDALAVASCYLSKASGHSVRRVVAHFDNGDGYLSVWQGIMDWQALTFIEGAARM